ncbi:MAG: response regulator [Anaerolineae bacterium]|nr:response regulator [Anaerolineae bacterium]
MTNKKALIIEDNKEIGEIYRLTIGMMGYDCEQITNGRVALERLDAEIPDLIILDMNLPEVSGHYLYKKIRASPNYNRVPVIISTANMLVARTIQEEMSPLDHLIVKPVHPRALTNLIEAINQPEIATTEVSQTTETSEKSDETPTHPTRKSVMTPTESTEKSETTSEAKSSDDKTE